MLTSTHKLNFRSGRSTKKVISTGSEQRPQQQGRLPRITKMMALAIRLDHLIKSGQVTDQAELARVGHVSRARLTQIMNLLYLAPAIQEMILELPPVPTGNVELLEKDLRTISSEFSWQKQRYLWQQEHYIASHR